MNQINNDQFNRKSRIITNNNIIINEELEEKMENINENKVLIGQITNDLNFVFKQYLEANEYPLEPRDKYNLIRKYLPFYKKFKKERSNFFLNYIEEKLKINNTHAQVYEK